MTDYRRVVGPGPLSAEARRRLDDADAPNGGDLPLPNLVGYDPAEVGRWRQQQHEAWGEDVQPGEADHVGVQIRGVACLVAGPVDGPLLVYAHGGGFCLGSPGTAVPITARLAEEFRVVSVDYRLAPEFPFPAAWDDVNSVVSALLHGADETDGTDGVGSSEDVFMGGDSAGAFLALSVGLERADPARADAARADPARADPARADRPRLPGQRRRLRGLLAFSPVVRVAPGVALFDAWLGGNVVDQGLSLDPERANDRIPILVQSSDTESLHAEITTWVDAAAAAGSPIGHQVWSGLWHAWHYHRELPEADAALAEARAWGGRVLKGRADPKPNEAQA